MVSTTALIGYVEPLGLHGGDTAQLKVSSNGPAACDVEILRMICGDPDPSGPGQAFEAMPWGGAKRRAVRFQAVNAGSCGRVDKALPLAPDERFTLTLSVYPTGPGGTYQSLVSWSEASGSGFTLRLDTEGRLEFSVGPDATVTTAGPLMPRHWYAVEAVIDPSAPEISLEARALRPAAVVDSAAAKFAGWRLPESGTPLLFAASMAGRENGRLLTRDHYNGKIEAPCLATGPDRTTVAAWDFAQEIDSGELIDGGPHRLHGRCVNLPMRAATGSNWNGASESWRQTPEQYGAIHFHDDDMVDCDWDTLVEIAPPEDARSGYYIARLTAPGVCSDVPFFVSARTGAPRARLLFIASTATYLSYANTHIKFDSLNTENLYESVMPISEDELYLNEHRELGLSHYDTHSDDSGVVYAGSRRPMLNTRPGLYSFNYLNDTHILKWLEDSGFDYDVATDEDLHRDGADLLNAYSAIMTGSHPEYYSTRMWDAVDAYQNAGGRHLYMGGNGFYWRIAYSSHHPGVIENRRGISGVRTWEGEPGEHHLGFTGEPGGLWRTSGRAPQALVGVGFSATLFVRSTRYRRAAASSDPKYAFIFDGVEGETIGDFGFRGGGAVGMEIDRWDPELGSPPGSVVLATSENPGLGALLSGEEFITTTRALDGVQNGKVRADMVFFETPGGGAVWSTGSIAWATSLLWNRGDNNVSRITRNVLERFLDGTPL